MRRAAINRVPGTGKSIASLLDLLEARAEDDEGKPAYSFSIDGENVIESLTYRELVYKSRCIASRIVEVVGKGERALLLFPPGLPFLPAFFGCLYAGVIAVPAYPPHRNRNRSRLESIVRDAEPKLVLTTAALLDQVRKAVSPGELCSLEFIASDSVSQERLEKLPDADLDTIAFLQYTSGSTGSPKGVVLSHGNLLYNAASVHYAVEHEPTDSYVSWLPVFHDMGFMAGVLQPLYGRLACIQLPPTAFLESPVRWLKAISVYQATTSGGPNFAYDLCVRKIPESSREELDLSRWDVAFNGAEPVRAETMTRFSDAFRMAGFRSSAFYPCYGLAEATLMVSGSHRRQAPVVAHFDRHNLERRRAEAVASCESAMMLAGCGRSLPGHEVVIVDPDTRLLCGIEEIGEIWFRGPSVAKGYWKRPDESRDAFAVYVEPEGAGPFFRTGDLGFLRGGELFIAGRLKDLLIIRGQNHYPQDIEWTIQHCHQSLIGGMGAAFSIEIRGEERLVAVHEAAHRQGTDFNAVLEAMRQSIAENHELVPYALVVIRTGSMPKTSSGKVQRRAARTAYLERNLHALAEWEEGTERETEPLLTGAALPRSELECWLAAHLSHTLGLSSEEIDPSRSLLAYGIDSLNVIELCHALQSRFNVCITPADIFEGLTYKELVECTNNLVSVPLTATDSPPGQPFQPLSYGQLTLWYLQHVSPNMAAYNIARAVQISSVLDIAILRRCFQTLVERHAALRMTYGTVAGEPFQTIGAPDLSFEAIEAVDWPDGHLTRVIEEASYRPFDLVHGPLLRVFVFRRREDQHVLLLVMHHIAVDFWSLAVLWDELRTLYSAHIRGQKPNLRPLPFSYLDFVRWQRDTVAANRERLEEYWVGRNVLDAPPLELPTDRPRKAARHFAGSSLSFALDGEVLSGLKRIASGHQCTLFTTLLALYQAFLFRITAQRDFAIGTPVTGRSSENWSGIVGYFVNPVPIRARVNSQQSFAKLLSDVRIEVLGALSHAAYPFALMTDKLSGSRGLDSQPIFQTMFVFQGKSSVHSGELTGISVGYAETEFMWGDLLVRVFPIDEKTAPFDLTVTFAEVDNKLVGRWQFDTDLFDQSTISSWQKAFVQLIKTTVGSPETRLDQLNILSDADQKTLLHEFNCTERNYSLDQLLHERITQQATLTPGRVAVRADDQVLTYGELNIRSNQIARFLQARGIGRESLVGVCMRRSPEMVASMLAIWKAGAAYVPLDPEYPEQRLRFMLEDTCSTMVLSEAAVGTCVARTPVPVVLMDAHRANINKQNGSNMPAASCTSGQLAYVLYTSGSTGVPKGVMVTHRNAMNLVLWAQEAFAVEERDAVLASTSICFDLSIFELWATLACGGTAVLAQNISEWWESQHRNEAWSQVTLVNTVPSALAGLTRGKRLSTTIQTLNLAGEALSETLVEQIYRDRIAERVHNLYGPSETTTYSTWAAPTVGKVVDIGRGIANTEVYVLDDELQPVPVGVYGQLYIAGEGLARGYWRRPALTAERFLPSPFSAVRGARMYATGDIVRWSAEGQLQYRGRVDHQVKVRGFRIELGEISAILNAHASIQESIVTVRMDGSEQQLVAYLTAKDEATVDINELQSHLAEKLPWYAVPSHYVVLAELPRTPNGKVNRDALPAPVVAGTGYTKARTLVERKLAEIWAEVLKVKSIRLEDGFFRLGGHSLMVPIVAARVQDEFRVELPLRKLFEHSTLEEMAEVIEEELKQDSSARAYAVERHLGTACRLSFAQARMWFLEQLRPGTSTYNIPLRIELIGFLRTTQLSDSLTNIIRRHEALRTFFPEEHGKPIQVVGSAGTFTLPFIDLRSCSANEKAEQLSHIERSESESPFNLTTGPLIRARLVRTEEQKHFLFLTMHHIVSDGPSVELLFNELTNGYGASEANGMEASEPEFQYRDYANFEEKWIQTELISHLSYWREKLKDKNVPLALPTSGLHDTDLTSKSHLVKAEIERGLADELRNTARKHGTTVFGVLLAAFKVFLARVCGQEEINIGTPIAGRTMKEFKNVFGLFTNTVVLSDRIQLSDTFCGLLHQVHQTVIEAFLHSQVPFEKVIEELQPERDLLRSPLFQVMLSYQHTLPENVTISGTEFKPLLLDNGAAKFELMLMMGERSSGSLESAWQYDAALFSKPIIEQWSRCFAHLLGELICGIDLPMEEISLLAPEDRQQLITKFSAPDLRVYDTEACLHHRIERQAALNPDRIALSWKDENVSYRALNERANQWSRYLVRAGIRLEDRIAVNMRRTPEMVAAMLGIWKVGGAYIPLDPEYPTWRIQFMLEDADTNLVISDVRVTEENKETRSKLVFVDTLREELEKQDRGNLSRCVFSQQIAYIINTSGSTGMPKGVVLTHRNGSSLVSWAASTFTAEQVNGVLASTSICFDLSVFELWATLCCGGRVILTHNILEWWQEKVACPDISLINTVPTVLAELLEKSCLPPTVETVNVAGEALSGSAVAAIRRSGSVQKVYNLYGPTETTTYSTFAEVKDSAPISIGRAVWNTQLYVLDRVMNPVPVGVTGELYIAGDGLARGYWARPTLTAEKFLPNPFSREAGDRMYRTGDLVRWLPDAALTYVGRLDQQIKLRGFRIELGEIEAALATYPDVRESAVILDEAGDKRILAYVSAISAGVVSSEEIRMYLGRRLPQYMLPASVIVLDELPRTQTGKLDRARLAKLDVQPTKSHRPLHEVEEIIAAIWGDVLNVKGIGPDDNFFNLGGHSLLTIQVMARVNQTFGTELPLHTAFERPILRDLAAFVENVRGQGQKLRMPRLLALPRGETSPLTSGQKRLWFLHKFSSIRSVYNVAGAVRLVGNVNEPAVRSSLESIWARQSALRLAFEMEGREPRQRVHDNVDVSYTYLNFNDSKDAVSDDACLSILQQEASRPFDLSHPGLARVILLSRNSREHFLGVTFHHIISDAWSIEVFVHEFSYFYGAYCRNTKLNAPPLTIDYRDYIAWEALAERRRAVEAGVQYWERMLREEPTPLLLPYDFARTETEDFAGGSIRSGLCESLTDRLRELGRKQNATLYMVLLAGINIYLSGYGREHDLLIGMTVANRSQPGTEVLIGLFVNEIGLRTSPAQDMTVEALIEHIRERAMEAYAHQEVPFNEILRVARRTNRELNRHPLFQVMVNYYNAPISASELAELQIHPVELSIESSIFDLSISFAVRDSSGVDMSLRYSSRFRRDTAKKIAEELNGVFKVLSANSQISLRDLERFTTRQDGTDQDRSRAQSGTLNAVKSETAAAGATTQKSN